MRGRGDEAADQQARHPAEPRHRDPAAERARHADPHAVELGDGGDVRLGEAEIDVERIGHHAGDEVGQPVDRHQREDDDERRAVAADEIGERLAEGAEWSRAPARAVSVEPRRQQAAADSDDRQARHGEIGGAPTDEIGDVERAGAGAQHRQPIAELIDRRHHALPLGRRGVDAPAVDRRVLGRGGEGGEEGEGDVPGQRLGGIAEGEAGEAQRDADLGERASSRAGGRASAPKPGGSKRSMIGAQANLKAKASAA